MEIENIVNTERVDNTSLSEKAAAAVAQLEQVTQAVEGKEAPAHIEPKEGAENKVFDIDGADKVMFQGKEYTPEELSKSLLRQDDYTRKTQKLAVDKKFYDNLNYDLENVRNNPQMVDQFKKIYPEDFHKFLDLTLSKESQEASEDVEESDSGVNETLLKRIDAMQNKLDSYDQKFHNEKVETANSLLDVKFEGLGKKYELADEDAIINKAQRILADNRDNQNFQMTDAAWERLFKSDHEAREKHYGDRQKRLLDAQSDKGKLASDGGPGGMAPGQERKRLTFEEATEMAIQDLGGR